MRTPLIVMAVLGVALLALAFATDDGGEERAAAAPAIAPVSVIAHRVEELRDLRFEQIPRPERVAPEQARREGLRSSTATTRRPGGGPTRRSSSCSG